MRILITGGGGFIGAALLSRLQETPLNSEVIGLKRAELDLTNAEATWTYLDKHRPSKIVHLASSLARGEDETSRARQWRDTFEGGRNLLSAAVAIKVPHILMAGSVEELGAQAGVLGTNLPAQPYTFYGLCKSLLRQLAEFHARRTAVRVDWFRPFTVYGPGQVGPLLIPYAFQMASASHPADFTDGVQERDFLYIDDLLNWLTLALRIDVTGIAHGEFHLHHLGTGVGTPVREILGAIAAEFPGAKFNLGARSRSPHEPMVQVAPQDRAPEPPLSYWVPTTPVRNGVAKTAAWWRMQRGGR